MSGDSFAEPVQAPLVLDPVPGHSVQVPILLYHFIRNNPDPKDRAGFALSVTPTDLDAQLTELQRAGVRTLSPDEFYAIVHSGRQPRGRVVLLTFDDGYADFASTAAPILHSHGMTAIDFVVSGFVGQSNYMTARQLQAVEHLGAHIGAHSVHHVPLAKVPRPVMVEEITQSKLALEALLGHSLDDFAYPFGSLDATVETTVRAAGFRTGMSTVPGTHQDVSDPYSLRRVEVVGGESLGRFDQVLDIHLRPGG